MLQWPTTLYNRVNYIYDMQMYSKYLMRNKLLHKNQKYSWFLNETTKSKFVSH